MVKKKKNGNSKRAAVKLNRSTKHKEVRVQWNGLDAQIDEEIAPLILELWKAGIMTLMSCQNNPEGWIWVQFPMVVFAEVFVDLMEKESDIAPHDLRQQWKYDIYPITLPAALFGDYPKPLIPKGPSLRFAISIRFPHKDLPTVLATLVKHNAPSDAIEETRDRNDV